MRKSVNRIICGVIATISAATLAFAPACGVKWSGVSVKDTSKVVEGTNGGFVTETADYVYFINGKTKNTDSNKFGTVLKGSVQRIKRTDFDQRNYASTETVVPAVLYSGSYNAGLYIYGDYIYYTSPTTEKNTDGEILNSNLDFKRTKLDGTGTEGYIWQSSDNAVDYRFVEVGNTVYILYALKEDLYDKGSTVTNIHSVNCNTKENTLLAYNVTDYAFDTEDAENACVYYTMAVPQFLGESSTYSYNQLFMVRADATTPREIDFSGVEDYDAKKDPIYVNCGDFVFDGIGKTNYESGRLSSLNFTQDKTKYTLINDDYTYDLQWYRNGELYYTRKSKGNSSLTNMYTLNLKDIDADGNGKVDTAWDAISKNAEQQAFIRGTDTTEYTFVNMQDKLYAISTTADGIFKSVVAGGKVEDGLRVSSDASATILGIREENGHWNLYYSTSGNGYKINRIAIDGDEDDYRKLPTTVEPDATYQPVKILDLDATSGWYLPEFVGNKLLFSSETAGQSSYNYIMVCDLSNKEGKMMTNNEVKKLNEKFEAVTDKIDKYDEEKNADGTNAYDGLANALKYLQYGGDVKYIDELVKAYQDVLGKDEEYIYSKQTVQKFKDFAEMKGDWAEYADDYITIKGEKVYATSYDYYYTLIGKMTEEDAEGLANSFKTQYMKEYPVDNSTWWEKLSVGGKAGFIIGMVVLGCGVIAGATVLTIFLIRRRKANGEEDAEKAFNVDITDDKTVDVYGGENGESGGNGEE